MNRKSESTDKNERDLYRIMVFSTSLGFGVLAAFLYSMVDIKNDVRLVFTPGTVVAFVIGAGVGWLFWRVIRGLAAREQTKKSSLDRG
jgi:hypothetical protein